MAIIGGDKSETKTLCSALADSGFVVASINYQLGWRTDSNLITASSAVPMISFHGPDLYSKCIEQWTWFKDLVKK